MKEKLNRERKKLMSYTNKELLNSIGLAYGELSLKGKNRGQFEKKLRNKIKKERNKNWKIKSKEF